MTGWQEVKLESCGSRQRKTWLYGSPRHLDSILWQSKSLKGYWTGQSWYEICLPEWLLPCSVDNKFGGGGYRRLQTELPAGRPLAVVLEKTQGSKRAVEEGCRWKNLKDMAPGQIGYKLYKERLGGVRQGKAQNDFYISMGYVIGCIAIYKNMDSKVTSFGETKYLQYTDSSPSFVLWGRQQRYYPQSLLKGVNIFAQYHMQQFGKPYYIPDSRAGKQGRQDPYVLGCGYFIWGGQGKHLWSPIWADLSFRRKKHSCKFIREEHFQTENNNWEVPEVETRLVCHWGRNFKYRGKWGTREEVPVPWVFLGGWRWKTWGPSGQHWRSINSLGKPANHHAQHWHLRNCIMTHKRFWKTSHCSVRTAYFGIEIGPGTNSFSFA